MYSAASPKDSSSTQRPPHRRSASSPSHIHHPQPHRVTNSYLSSDIYSPPNIMAQTLPPPSSASSPSMPRTPKTSTRLMASVRRSFSVVSSTKRRQVDAAVGMYSTPAERSSHATTSRYSTYESPSPPTVEQIAMGLHVSRTPHLRQHHPYSQRSSTPLSESPSSSTQHHPQYNRNSPYSSRPQSQNGVARRATVPAKQPPAPTRSSLKKSSTILSSNSTSTGTTDPDLSTGSSTTVTSNSPSTPSSRSVISLKTRMTRILSGSRSSPSPSSMLSSPTSSPRDSTSELQSVKKAVRFTPSPIGTQELD